MSSRRGVMCFVLFCALVLSVCVGLAFGAAEVPQSVSVGQNIALVQEESIQGAALIRVDVGGDATPPLYTTSDAEDPPFPWVLVVIPIGIIIVMIVGVFLLIGTFDKAAKKKKAKQKQLSIKGEELIEDEREDNYKQF